ncbi:MAG: aminoacyl-tRNA hydrolase [Synergistaceae bacterium]|nr:aminoacyl-tRNA hydrolase [Synergistaceae bacterium]
MKLVVGLGNPGPEYVWSRHNSGWLVIDSFVKRIGQGEPRMKFGGAFWLAAPLEGESVAFLKPFTYMNLSGKSVMEAVRYHDVAPGDVFVVFDDAALPFGRLRYRATGSAGGQKGMISILGALGTLDVPRMRVGVGSPDSRIDMRDWVLGKFPKEQRAKWPEIEELAWDGLLRWLGGSAGDGFTVRVSGSGE